MAPISVNIIIIIIIIALCIIIIITTIIIALYIIIIIIIIIIALLHNMFDETKSSGIFFSCKKDTQPIQWTEDHARLDMERWGE